MFVSVIIPTYKRPKDLKIALDSLCQQTILPNETIIVDQSPDEETKRLCSQKKYIDLGMKYFFRKDLSSARARNQGIEELDKESDLVLFFDDDVKIDVNYIQEVIRFLRSHPQAVGGGGQEVNKGYKKDLGYFLFDNQGVKAFFSALNAQKKATHQIQKITSMSGATLFVRKYILDAGYHFPEWMDRYSFEDLFFSFSVGRAYPGKFFYLPLAKIFHYESPVARVSYQQRLKQGLSHMFLFYRQFGFSPLRFYWRSIGYFLHFRGFFLLGEWIKSIYWLFLHRKKIMKCPQILNDFIFT